MIKKWLIIGCVSAFSTLTTIATVQAEIAINTAEESALQSIKGIGPTRAKLIISERNQNGPYRNAEDLAERIRGLSQKSVARLEAQGLIFGNVPNIPPLPKNASKTIRPKNKP